MGLPDEFTPVLLKAIAWSFKVMKRCSKGYHFIAEAMRFREVALQIMVHKVIPTRIYCFIEHQLLEVGLMLAFSQSDSCWV